MSFRSTIFMLLLLGATAGCDKQDSANGQAEAASTAIPAPAARGATSTGTIDRSHKGEAPPTVSLIAPDGGKTMISAFKGKPVLVNLWATWCAPCIKEMPTLDVVAGRMTVVAVSQDLDGAAKVTPFLAKAGLKNIKPYLDPQVAMSTAYQASLPTSILYDSNGKEVWRAVGGMDWTSKAATDLLAEAT
uniref:TlpA family protein disulfide reductase n=1 Tax=Sphingomonas sp. TaxID=28214 RepID=UPI0025F3FC23|nr:TlpA disulfide reductase family protein [Sphingomonas sp.]